MRKIKSGGKVFRDPVHQLIRIAPEDAFILDLIDTPEFQRLRRIHQLGVSWLTYHGAEHSRFAHSLGVFNFAQRILESLLRRHGSANGIAKTIGVHGRTIKAAALLHDVGHLPFSHMLERAFESKHHEDWTIELISDKNSNLNSVLRKHGVVPADVASIIRKDFPVKLAVDIVSSQLDADRMDYLLRDSYCTGVAYGEFDSNWLLHSMCVGQMRDAGGTTAMKLCLDAGRGLYAAERFITARLHMYQQVYMHRVTRGFEVLVLNLFSAAGQCAKIGHLPQGTPPLVEAYFKNRGRINSRDFLRFDESQITSAFHIWARATTSAHKTIRRLSSAFLNRERIYSAVDLDGAAETMLNLGKSLDSLPKEADGHTRIYGIDTVQDTPYKGMLYRAAKDAKREDAAEGVNESILLMDPASPDRAKPVETVSTMLKHMDAEQFTVTRLYFDRERRKDIEPIAKALNLSLTDGGGQNNGRNA